MNQITSADLSELSLNPDARSALADKLPPGIRELIKQRGMVILDFIPIESVQSFTLEDDGRFKLVLANKVSIKVNDLTLKLEKEVTGQIVDYSVVSIQGLSAEKKIMGLPVRAKILSAAKDGSELVVYTDNPIAREVRVAI